MKSVSKRDLFEYYKRQSEDYSRMYANPRNAYKKRRRIEATWDFLRRWRPKMGRVLEVGCGDGYFTSHAAKACSWSAYVGVDLSLPKLLSFRERIPASCVISADAEVLPFPSNAFDTVLCFETLEHLIEPEAALQGIYRVLKPGGLLILSTPFVSALHVLGKRVLLRFFPSLDSHEGFEEHLQEFTGHRLRQILRQNGFRPIALKACLYDFSILDSPFRYVPYSWYRRIDGWLSHFPMGTLGIGKLRISMGAEYIFIAAEKGITLGRSASFSLRPQRSRRRDPRPWDESYLVHKPLLRALKQVVITEPASRSNLVLLDIGCSGKPYEPLFRKVVSRHIGLDSTRLNPVDVVGYAEHLPIKAQCIDVILCTQVLEHLEDPLQGVNEMCRVLKPNGIALVSTHGVQVYHPSPNDYWRWTAAGLRKLFLSKSFEDVKILPNGGTFGCIFYLLATYINLLLGKGAARYPLLGPLLQVSRCLSITLLNVLGEGLDRLFPFRRDPDRPNTLTPNFLVLARPSLPI